MGREIEKKGSKSTRLSLAQLEPRSPDAMWQWIRLYTGVKIARHAVCPGHHAPWDFFRSMYFDRPPVLLALGGRGAGKSFLTALGSHLMCRWNDDHKVRVLGGSLAQSRQIYEAMSTIGRTIEDYVGDDHEEFTALRKESAIYPNRSQVMILAASRTSVRGPHIPTLLLDEVDEIPVELRESAIGMCMNQHGMSASTIMTSTWHRVGGPMTELMARGEAGEFPLFRFCIFEVMERCDATRSGQFLEKCPECPLVKWCHDVHDGGPPRAKRSDGHYAIDAVIQKIRCVSAKVFEADYLCMGPRADGIWFGGFDKNLHVTESAEYRPGEAVHLGLDTGVFTGAVTFQISWENPPNVEDSVRNPKKQGLIPKITVFGEYLSEGQSAENNAIRIQEWARSICNGRVDKAWTDPAGKARNPIGPTVLSEYERVGLKLTPWPLGPVADSLARVESLLSPAFGAPRLTIHPRCRMLIQAFENYRRARRSNQWQDWPEDPQHPHEDLMDALRGGLRAALPEDRSDFDLVPRVSAKRVF